MTSGKYGGRPKRKPEPGERVHLGFRVPPKLKRDLEKAAKDNTRSISQEAEIRMQGSFTRETPLGALERTLGGPEMRDKAILMAAAFSGGGWRHSGGRKPDEWLKDTRCYLEAIKSVVEALMLECPNVTVRDIRDWLQSLQGRLEGRFVVDTGGDK